MEMQQLWASVVLLVILAASARSLPTPTTDNSFFIMPIWEPMNYVSEQVAQQEVERLKQQIGTGNDYHRIGFSFICPPAEMLERNAKIAQRNNITLGPIFATQVP